MAVHMCSYIATTLLWLAVSVAGHGVIDPGLLDRYRANVPVPVAPSLPQYFSMDWWIFANITTNPPYTKFPAGDGVLGGRGTTYYDWRTKSMVEEYHDFCIPIWPDFPIEKISPFSCAFVNGPDHVSYVVTDPKSSKPPPPGWPAPCCTFANPWFAPPPDFASLFMTFDQFNTINGAPTHVYTMNTGKLGGGIFYYEFYNNNGSKPATFAFPGAAEGTYVIQFWSNWTYTAPNPAVFEAPAICKGAPTCPSPGGVPVDLVPPHSGHDKCIYPGNQESTFLRHTYSPAVPQFHGSGYVNTYDKPAGRHHQFGGPAHASAYQRP